MELLEGESGERERAVAAGRLWRKALALVPPQGVREGGGCWQMRVRKGGREQ